MKKSLLITILMIIYMCLQSSIVWANMGSDMEGLDKNPGQYKYCKKKDGHGSDGNSD